MKKLVLLVNLGTPNAPTSSAVKKYLGEFLSDPRVVELPRLVWLPLLHGIILPLRSKKSAQAYQKIWTQSGSPLHVFTAQLALQLQKVVPDATVAFAMRYGSPSCQEVLAAYQNQLEQLIVIPLYPQYANSSTGSSLAKIFEILQTWRIIPKTCVLNQYFQHPTYIQAITQSINNFWQTHERHQQLIFSYHGIPLHCLKKGEPYYDQCLATTTAVANALGLANDEYKMVFQSRFGKTKWLEPACDQTLKSLPKSGIETVDVICPGFAVDCLETLEEINMQNRDLFLQAGGKNYAYIPCLNATLDHIALLGELVHSCVI